METELTEGSSRASGSQVDDSESVGSRGNLERTAGWPNSVAQHSCPSWPLSPNVQIDPPKSVTQDRSAKRISAYLKITPLFQPGAGLFSAQLQDSSNLKKPEIPKSNRVTKQQTVLLKTTFQQQGPTRFQNRQRSQSPKQNSCNRSTESQIKQQWAKLPHKYFTNRVVTQEDYPKIKRTEVSREPLEWPEWAELLVVIVHQNRLSDTEKMQCLKISLTGQAKVAISGLGFSSQAYYQARDILCKKFGRPRVIVESQLKNIYTRPPLRHDDSSSNVRFSNVVTNTVNV